jgi:NAD(P)-dependent dehydrogenase (short-subunit alcohol dehydrogenase family)
MLKNRAVLITGAASGIGAALALECARLGANLVLFDRRRGPLHQVASRVRALGRPVLMRHGDVAGAGNLTRLVSAARKRFGRLDIVIADAGFEVTGRVEDLTLADFRRQFDTNVFGTLRTIYATVEDLKRSRGALVIVGSLLGHVALPATAPYAMSKFAVTALAQVLRFELASAGVSVTLVSPGNVATNIRRVDKRNVLHPHVKDPLPKWPLMSPTLAARTIMTAVLRRRPEVILTRLAKFTVLAERLAPALVSRAIELGHFQGHQPPSGRTLVRATAGAR